MYRAHDADDSIPPRPAGLRVDGEGATLLYFEGVRKPGRRETLLRGIELGWTPPTSTPSLPRLRYLSRPPVAARSYAKEEGRAGKNKRRRSNRKSGRGRET